MKDITKKYSNGEVTIIWKPALCIHSRKCFSGLAEVFHPQDLPWITPQHSTTEKIIAQIKQCPSGALSYEMDSGEPKTNSPAQLNAQTVVEPARNGPLMIHGTIALRDASGNLTTKENVTAFCRCGGSSNKPFCDGTHRKIGFEG